MENTEYLLERKRDRTRATIAISLISLLFIEVTAAIVMPFVAHQVAVSGSYVKTTQHKQKNDASSDDRAQGGDDDSRLAEESANKLNGTIEKMFSLIFGPTVALVGSATGFYFGTKSERTALNAPPPPPGAAVASLPSGPIAPNLSPS